MPPAILSNDDLAKFLDTSDDWIVSRTGIQERRISHVGVTELAAVAGARALACAGLEPDDVDAVILATPTQMHADQAVACIKAGKPVLIEIPMADSLEDSERICAVQKETGVVAMAGQVRRFNPSHQWIRNKIDAGELTVQRMDVQGSTLAKR